MVDPQNIPEKDQVNELLQLLLQVCNDALKKLTRLPQDDQQAVIPLETLQHDFGSILTLIYGATTKVALTMKPSSPTYRAACAPLSDLANNTMKLGHCASLFHSQNYGKALSKEVAHSSQDIIDAVKVLGKTLADPDSSETGQAGDEYMHRTGAIHAVIDHARSSNGVSHTNMEAVKKAWKQNEAGLEDAMSEAEQMASGTIGEDVEDDDEFDDEFDDLGFGSTRKMNEQEIAVAKTMHTMMRLTTLLHKRMRLDVLSITQASNDVLDGLLEHSSAMVAAYDDLVAELYAPQDHNAIHLQLDTYLTTVGGLRGSSTNVMPSPRLEESLEDLSLQRQEAKGAKKDKKDIAKWFQTCFAQIYKASDQARATLKPQQDSLVS